MNKAILHSFWLSLVDIFVFSCGLKIKAYFGFLASLENLPSLPARAAIHLTNARHPEPGYARAARKVWRSLAKLAQPHEPP
jgi:hypothetical protein